MIKGVLAKFVSVVVLASAMHLTLSATSAVLNSRWLSSDAVSSVRLFAERKSLARKALRAAEMVCTLNPTTCDWVSAELHRTAMEENAAVVHCASSFDRCLETATRFKCSASFEQCVSRAMRFLEEFITKLALFYSLSSCSLLVCFRYPVLAVFRPSE
jgi:hypothetical protein